MTSGRAEPGGDGWWQATNGRWYPPEEHPWLPHRQTSPGVRFGVGLIAAGILALVLLYAVAAFYVHTLT